MKTLKFISSALLVGLVLLFSGCADDDDFKVAPTSEDAAFTFSFDPENPNRVIFAAEPNDSNWYTHWDFGG